MSLRQFLRPVALAAVLALLCAALRPCAAHEAGAPWLRDEPRYVAADGAHCCGEECRPAAPGDLRYRAGAWLHLPTGTAIPVDEPGVYTSRDPEGRAWACVLRGRLRCVFTRTGL